MLRWRVKRPTASLRFQARQSCAFFRTVPSPLQGTSAKIRVSPTRAPPPPPDGMSNSEGKSLAFASTEQDAGEVVLARTRYSAKQQRWASASLERTAPVGAVPAALAWRCMASTICADLLPGAAQRSRQRSSGRGARSNAGTSETISWKLSAPLRFSRSAHARTGPAY